MRERMRYCVARSPLPSTARALEGSYASDPGTSDGRMQGRGRNRTKIESALKSLAACWFNIRHPSPPALRLLSYLSARLSRFLSGDGILWRGPATKVSHCGCSRTHGPLSRTRRPAAHHHFRLNFRRGKKRRKNATKTSRSEAWVRRGEG